MARTRQTARKSNSTYEEPKHNFAGIAQNRELLEKYIKRNCRVMMKSSLQNVVKEDRIDIQTKFAPYRDCMKVARLWILKDMLKNNENCRDENISPSVLTVLPLDVKIEIISYIPTFSNVYMGSSYTNERGALKKTFKVQDPWFFTYIKHRLVSRSVRSHLEQLIFKRMREETLDFSVFLKSVTPSLHLYRIKLIQFLLTEQNRYFSEKNTEYRFLNLPPREEAPIKDVRDFTPHWDEDESLERETSEKDDNIVDGDRDLALMSLEELELIENNLVQELPNKSVSIFPFQKESKTQNVWNCFEFIQRSLRKEIHSTLYYYEPYNNFYDSKQMIGDEDSITIDQEPEKENNVLNEHVKSIKISFSDISNIQQLAETILKFTKIDRLEMEVYESYEGTRHLNQFTNVLPEEFYEGLDTVVVTYSETFSTIYNHLAMLGKLSAVKNFYLKAILDVEDVVNLLNLVYSNHNIYLNSKKVQEVESGNNLYISSITVSDIKNTNNPWFAARCLVNAISVNKVFPIETQKEIADIVLKRFSPVLLRIENSIETWISYSENFAILQYIIYLANTFHDGKLFLNINQYQELSEKTMAKLIHSGWDISNQITQVFPSLGPDFGQLLLDHWSQITQQNLCKLNIPQLRTDLFLIINGNRNCRLLAFLCEYCSTEDKIELFKNFQFGRYADQYLETNLVNIICDNADGPAFSYILKYLHPSLLLEKSLKVKSSKIITSTSLHYALDNQKITNESIAAMIEMQPLLVHIADNEEITPLHQICVLSSRWSLVPLLLKYNADIHAKDRNGETPLDYLKRNYPFYKFIFPYLHELSP